MIIRHCNVSKIVQFERILCNWYLKSIQQWSKFGKNWDFGYQKLLRHTQ